MGTTLTGTTPQATYDSLIKVTDNGPLSGTAKYLTDGLGNDSPLALSTGAVGIGTNSLFGKFNLADASNARLEATPVADGVSFEVLDSARANPLDFKVYANDILFNTKVSGSYSERMRITSTGTVGINSTPPSSVTLDIKEADAGADLILGLSAGTGARSQIRSGADLATASNLQFHTVNASSTYERMRITSAGNVGIGTTSPDKKLQVAGAIGVQSETSVLSSSDTGMYLSTGGNTSNYNGLFFQGVSLKNMYIGRVGQSGVDDLIVSTAEASPVEIVRFRRDGGITFNGDTAAANALDDYEEGTWTPSLQIGGQTAGITYTVQSGRYTKIGRQVSANCYIVLSSKGTNTGTARLYGLPFTIPNSLDAYSPATFYNDGNITYTGQFQAFGNTNSTSIVLAQVTEAGSSSDLTDTNFANTSAFMISITYSV